jgi:hypothetical protein
VAAPYLHIRVGLKPRILYSVSALLFRHHHAALRSIREPPNKLYYIMPKPRDSMYSESIYSQSSWAPSITPSLLDKFPPPPKEDQAVPPLPKASISKLTSIAEERGKQDTTRRTGLRLDTTVSTKRRRSASFSGLTNIETQALAQIPIDRYQSSAKSRSTKPVQDTHHTVKTKRPHTTTAQYEEPVVLKGMFSRQIHPSTQKTKPTRLAKSRPTLPESVRGVRSQTPSTSATIPTFSSVVPTLRGRQPSQPFTIRSGRRTPATITGTYLHPNNFKYATTQERLRAASHSEWAVDQHGSIRTNQEGPGNYG